jgi:quinol monooxygenase YgiN
LALSRLLAGVYFIKFVKYRSLILLNMKKSILTPLYLVIVLMTSFFSGKASAQEKKQIVRLAKLVIDSSKLESYKALLMEGIETAVRVEPGVLTLYAVSEKDNPTHITILEIYADAEAYKAHLLTPHFIKYKTGTKDMIKSLELVETVPIVPGMKIK